MVTIKIKFMLKAPKGYPTLYGWWGQGKGKGTLVEMFGAYRTRVYKTCKLNCLKSSYSLYRAQKRWT